MIKAGALVNGEPSGFLITVWVASSNTPIYQRHVISFNFHRVMNTSRGMKLDFKTIEVLEPAMKILAEHLGSYQQPIWINSDIFKGPNAPGSTPVNATEFKRIVLENFPEATLSIGWTTDIGSQVPGGGGTRSLYSV